ncbi:T9SS type A sorting domain-containing protein, partial [bacterium]|nr:T9SS type A sorting domain-containing protein [bacterium]
TNYHEVVYTGETVSFWDVHNKSSVDQEPFEAIDDFDLKIFWYHDGYPYLIWNQTTPQGTLYKVYRKVGCFGQWEHIAGPSYRLYYRDHDVTKSGNTTIYYYIKETTNNKTTSTKSITGNYAPTDKEILINVVSLDPTLISSAYPNPFNPVTTISFYISESNQVKIEIYNISGKLIKTLYKGYKEAGNHEITWDATKYSAGVYFYKVRAGRLTEINKCLLMK